MGGGVLTDVEFFLKESVMRLGRALRESESYSTT
jgi:hypothetical protein